jgi:hypothetical protein
MRQFIRLRRPNHRNNFFEWPTLVSPFWREYVIDVGHLDPVWLDAVRPDDFGQFVGDFDKPLADCGIEGIVATFARSPPPVERNQIVLKLNQLVATFGQEPVPRHPDRRGDELDLQRLTTSRLLERLFDRRPRWLLLMSRKALTKAVSEACSVKHRDCVRCELNGERHLNERRSAERGEASLRILSGHVSYVHDANGLSSQDRRGVVAPISLNRIFESTHASCRGVNESQYRFASRSRSACDVGLGSSAG